MATHCSSSSPKFRPEKSFSIDLSLDSNMQHWFGKWSHRAGLSPNDASQRSHTHMLPGQRSTGGALFHRFLVVDFLWVLLLYIEMKRVAAYLSSAAHTHTYHAYYLYVQAMHTN